MINKFFFLFGDSYDLPVDFSPWNSHVALYFLRRKRYLRNLAVMLRAVARRLSTSADVRQLVLRINAIEASILELQRFKEVVERCHPEVAEQAKLMSIERRSREQAANAQGPAEAMRLFEEMPLTPKEFEDLHQFYALHPVEEFPMASLTNCEPDAVVMELANKIQRQYVVRVARCAAQLNNAPLGLSLMHSIQELRKWYEFSFHDASTLPPVTNRAGLLEFTKLLKRIFVRHLNTATLVSQGLSELALRDEWTPDLVLRSSFLETFQEVESTVSAFCDARIRLRFLVVHMLYLLCNYLGQEIEHDEWTIQEFFGHDPATFRGAVCLETSLLGLTKHAVRAVQAELPHDISGCITVSVVGDETATIICVPQLVTEMIASLVSDAVSPRSRAAPPVENAVSVTVVQHPKSSEFAVQVSDQAGGMPLRELLPRQTYLATTGVKGPKGSCASWRQPMALPYAAAVARTFGGCITTATVESYGTDRVLHLPRHGFESLKI